MNSDELETLIRSCIRKYRYPTAQTAQEAINRVHKKRSTPLRYYYCKRCCGYHLTKKNCGEVQDVEIKNKKVNKCRNSK